MLEAASGWLHCTGYELLLEEPLKLQLPRPWAGWGVG